MSARALPRAQRSASARAWGRYADDRLDGARRPHRRLRARPHGHHRRERRRGLRHLARGSGRVPPLRASRRPSAPSRRGSSRRRSFRSRCRGRRAIRCSSTTTSIRAPARPAEALGSCAGVPEAMGAPVTAGNASGLNDGASAHRRDVAAHGAGARPGAARNRRELRVGRSRAPRHGGRAPSPRRAKALAKVGLGVEDVDLFELNEAFAAQSLAVRRELGLAADRVNPHGGAIALGHPIGAERRAHPGHAAARDETRAPAPRRRHAVRRWRTRTGRRDPQRGKRRVARPGRRRLPERHPAASPCTLDGAWRQGPPLCCSHPACLEQEAGEHPSAPPVCKRAGGPRSRRASIGAAGSATSAVRRPRRRSTS